MTSSQHFDATSPQPPTSLGTDIEIQNYGAHVLHAPHETGDLFFLSSKAVLDGSQAIRGGLPLIAPRFANLMEGTKHGWARTTNWKVEGLSAECHHDNFELQFQVSKLDSGYEFTLSIANKAESSRAVQLAFHPYFAVDDIENVGLDGVSGMQVWDHIADVKRTQAGSFTFSGNTEFFVPNLSEVEIHDTNRFIHVSANGTDHMVLWNPGAELAATIDDLGEGEWRNFVCVEPALLGQDYSGVELAPGEKHAISMRISAKPR